MNKEYIPLIAFDEKKTWLLYVPLFILRKISFKLYAKKVRMLSTIAFKDADLDVTNIIIRKKL